MRTILWILRFQRMPFLAGVMLITGAGYVLFFLQPATDLSTPWVAAPFALGNIPWILAFAFGIKFLVFAWHKARNREM